MPSIATPTHWEFSMSILKNNVGVLLLRAWIFGIWALYRYHIVPPRLLVEAQQNHWISPIPIFGQFSSFLKNDQTWKKLQYNYDILKHENNGDTVSRFEIIDSRKYRMIYSRPAKCSNLYRIYRKYFIRVICNTVGFIL